MDDGSVGRQLSGDGSDDRLVADQDDLVAGVRARVVQRARDDLRRSVIPAHRVDGDANPGARGAGRPGLRLGHRVSARRRLRQA
jgi:hypothetical protein